MNKFSTLTNSAVSDTGPRYLSELTPIYTPERLLLSSSGTYVDMRVKREGEWQMADTKGKTYLFTSIPRFIKKDRKAMYYIAVTQRVSSNM